MLPAESPVARLLAALKHVKPAGEGQWMALCPGHNDKEQSLSIRTGTDGRVLVKCHAGCGTIALLAAIGMTLADLFPATSQLAAQPSSAVGVASHVTEKAAGVTTRPKLIASYDYYAADGTLRFQTCRFEPKTFRQRRRNGNGEWIWKLDGVEPVLYRLPEIIEAVAMQRRIYVVEGEKDVATLVECHLDATTSPMGAGKWKESYSEVLAGADVVVIPDNDETGRNHAEQVAASLTAKGSTVRVVTLPGLPEKGDVTDWLNAGHDADDLLALVRSTAVWQPEGTPARTRWRLDELLENDEMMRPPPPVVPYLAWSARSTLLAAREKSGKSTLTSYLAAQVSRGADFLDEPCAEGVVLIVGLEEFLGDTARRLREFDAAPTRVEIVDHFRRPATERLDEIRQHIADVRPVLVILDSLIAFSQGVITDATNATQTQATVQGLTTLAHQTGVALIIIHHARKSDGKYRDSSAIGGAVDIIAEVFCPDEAADPTRRRVRPLGRVPSRAVDFRFDGHSYSRSDASGPMKAPIEQRILDVVRERPGISANDVADAVQENRRVVLDRLKLMVHQHVVLNDGTASFYRLRLPTYPPAPRML